MRISDWSSDVCSSDLLALGAAGVDVDEHHGPDPEVLDAGGEHVGDLGAGGPVVVREQALDRGQAGRQIGRASCRERVWQAVLFSVVAGSLKKKKTTQLASKSI